ncbi:MAG: hypothetical protein JRF57_08870 [Deltaproteobacteria bacterium]|nr:hypothetical protein [Deltaproteobacteria bacterium]
MGWKKGCFLGFIAAFLVTLLCQSPVRAETGEKKTLALLPFVLYADASKAYLRPGLKSMFVSRLSGEGIELVPDDEVSALLGAKEKEQGVSDPKRAKELALKLKVDFVVYGSVTAMGPAYSLDLSILDVKKGKVTRVSESTEEDQLITRLADVAYQFRAAVEGIDIRALRMARLRGLSADERATRGLFFRPDAEMASITPTGRMPLRVEVMAFDMGDLDGDGETEMVVLGRRKLLLYKKEGDSFALKGTLEPGMGESFLKVSIGDGDGDGRGEIYLTSQYGLRARSRVWEWKGGFRERLTIYGHLQVIRVPHRGLALILFQDTATDDFFHGKKYVMEYASPGKLVRKEALKGLKKAQFYTLTLYDLNRDTIPEFLGLDNDSYLCVWSRDGDVLWKSTDKVGGTNNYIKLRQRSEMSFIPLILFNSRVLVTDIDKDGNMDVLAIKNIPMIGHLEQFQVYVKSKLIVYRIKGTDLVPSLSSMKMNYCLMDMQIQGQTLYLAAQKPRLSNIGEGYGRIMWFE